MTQAQERAIERVRKMAKQTFYGDNYEFKKFEVTEYDHFVAVWVVTGMIGDEGTMASVFARDEALFFIGPKGALTYPVTSKRTGEQVKKSLGKSNNFLTVVCAQRIG